MLGIGAALGRPYGKRSTNLIITHARCNWSTFGSSIRQDPDIRVFVPFLQQGSPRISILAIILLLIIIGSVPTDNKLQTMITFHDLLVESTKHAHIIYYIHTYNIYIANLIIAHYQ